MKTHLALLSLIALALPVHAAAPAGSPKPGKSSQSSPATQPAKGDAGQKATSVSKPGAGETTESALKPAPTVPTAPTGNVTLDAYIKALTDAASLSKDEQTDIKTYYVDDGAKLTDILNSATLTPFEQDQQVEDLRDTRNAKIESLLRDADRQDAFRKTEAMYRVALTELAETGGLAPASLPPTVSQTKSAP